MCDSTSSSRRAGMPFAVVAVAALLSAACGGAGPVLSADPSGLTLYEQGRQALADEDWRDAAEAFDTLLKNYPSSPYLAEARLGYGKAQFETGRADSLVLAIDAFQAFLTYHPSHERTDYAQYMVGMCYAVQMRAADRDQSSTEDAVEAFERFLENYPNSGLVPEVLAQLQRARDRLAESQLRIARWQLLNGHPEAARDRALETAEQFPTTGLRCDLLWVAGEATYRNAQQPQDSARYFQEIVDSYPGCRYASDAANRLRDLGDRGGRAADFGF